MHVLNRWRRSAAALAAAAAIVPLTAATADAAPVRTAKTTDYTNATYLQHALGLPATETDPAIESVTYDHFQWLLQQPGNTAVLIGDPVLDPTFAARAREVEIAADAAGLKNVYWFDPNLSGSAQVGTITEPALDIRNSSAITQINATSQGVYRTAWLHLIANYLGNGASTKLESGDVGDEDPRFSSAIGGATATTNDAGEAAGGVLYDYSGGAAPAKVLDSYFLVYNKDRTSAGKAAKIVSWVDLTANGSAAVGPSITALGGANFTTLDQFAWWKSSVNERQLFTSTSDARGKQVPVLGDADKANGGWRINQVTYPELVDLLSRGADNANAVILFGGTWCPNTRPVVGAVNKYAQENDVQVFNFDTVLDGGTVGGATTSAVNPLQTRNAVNNGSGAAGVNANPTSLYGDLVSQYLTNIKTEYKLGTSSVVSYFPGGDTTGTSKTVNKLQVPFVIGYQGKAGDAPNGGITRQWIINNADGSFKEYMSQWWLTNPQPNQLGISTIPLTAPVWTKLNAQLPAVTYATDPAPLYANTGTEGDDDQFLVDGEKANVTYNASNGTVTASTNASGAFNVGPAALAQALAALGADAPANLAALRATLLAAYKASPQDTTTITKFSPLFAVWGVAQSRKNSVNSMWGNATNPSSVIGGLAAVHALDVFFGGLPGGVASRRTVTADPVKYPDAAKIGVAIANDFGRVPTGDVSLVVKRGGSTVASASTPVAGGAAAFTLGVLDAGTYEYTLSYAGDDQIAAFTETGSLTVSPGDDPVVNPIATPTPIATAVPTQTPTPTITRVKASKVAGAVAKAPTSRKAGKYKVTIAAPKGLAAATGKVTIKLKKGKTTKTITAKLARGTVTVSLPKLARGTWKVTIAWAGDSTYLAASATGASIKVAKE